MNKVLVLFLITVFMCANTSIGQLLKVPNLIEHFTEHKNAIANKSVSFIDFIKDHYSKNTENNKKEHQDLPFKTIDTTTTVLINFPLINYQLIEKNVFFEASKGFFYKNSFKSNLFTSIWLPPKLS